jgi:hypothetical protein
MIKHLSSDAYNETASENALELAITEYVARNGGKCWHARDSRGQNLKGMLDLHIVLPPTVMDVELKSQKRVVTTEQQETLALLARCSEFAYAVVRPSPKPGEVTLDELFAYFDRAIAERRR